MIFLFYLSCNVTYDDFRFVGHYIHFRYNAMSNGTNEKLDFENIVETFRILFILDTVYSEQRNRFRF